MAEFAALEKVAADFGRMPEALRRRPAEPDRDLQALAQWDGDAARAYRTALGEWQAAADDMTERLAALHKVLVTAHRNHGASLNTNLATWDVV